jgi:predicted amidohydrolase
MLKDRKIQVSTCTFEMAEDLSAEHPATWEQNMAQAELYMEKAGKAGSDIMVLPELFNSKGMKQWFEGKIDVIKKEIGEKVPGGKTIDTVAEYARKYSMYVAACILENDNEKFYNSVVLVDRKGKVAGKYRKSHLPQGEEKCVLPGNDLPVFKTDFGTIGMLVCYDLNFPEAAITLSLKGAEMILWPTMWPSLFPSSFYMDTFLKGTALMNGVYLVSSSYSKPDPDSTAAGRSAIVSPTGMILADTGFTPGFATAELWLERRKMKQTTVDLATHKHEFRRKEWSLQRRPELYKVITSPKKSDNNK